MVGSGPDIVGNALQERLRRNPQDQESYSGLKEHYRGRGELASMVNLIVGWASYTANPDARAQAYKEAGEVVSRELGDGQRAVEYLRKALHFAPLDTDTSELLQLKLCAASAGVGVTLDMRRLRVM